MLEKDTSTKIDSISPAKKLYPLLTCKVITLDPGTRLKPKCLFQFAAYRSPPEFLTMCAYQHFMGINSSFSSIRKLNVEFGNDLDGVLVWIYLQSSCGSPFLGKYVGTVTPRDVWVTVIIRGKELIIDRQGEETRYPGQLPALFRSAPAEDYSKDVCIHLCQNRIHVDWEFHRDYNLSTCEIDQNVDVSLTNHELCSPDECHDETAFASIDYFMEYLAADRTNLNKTQLQIAGTMGNNSDVWVEADCSFYTVKNINIKKKFEEFLAEIGGNFGLLAGASILTLIEIGEFVFKISKRIFFHKRKSVKTCVPQTQQIGENKA